MALNEKYSQTPHNNKWYFEQFENQLWVEMTSTKQEG